MRRTSDNVSVVIIGLPALAAAARTPTVKGTTRGMVSTGGTETTSPNKPAAKTRGGLLGRLLGGQ
jgi:hypothetical protein